MFRTVLLFALLASPVALAPAGAQDVPPPTLFQEIFPQPTGQNGYEEIVAAGEMLAKSALFVEGEQAGLGTLTLTKKRALLADPPVREALILFRQGLAKSLHTPRDKSQDPALKAFGLYRRLARVLAVELYVCCADGRMSQAIGALEDGLRLGYAVQRDSLIGGLVGVAIDAVGIGEVQKHLDQLSEKDCSRLIRLAKAWHDAPDPAIEAMAAERELILRNLAGEFPTDTDFPREQVLAGMRARLDHYAANLTKPVWERQPPPPLQGNPIVADYINKLGETLDPLFLKTQTVFVRDQAKMQILGVHASVRQYRWEHDSLPDSLGPLRLGPLGLDPFTGKPLRYRVMGAASYELSSEGLKLATP